MNIVRLAAGLKEHQAALILSEENRRYFTEFDASNGYLLVSPAHSVFITDGRYIEAARAEVPEAEVLLQGDIYEQLNRFFAEQKAEEVLLEESRVTLSDCHALKHHLPGLYFVTDQTLDEKINALRSVKTAAEAEKMQEAQDIASKSLLEILPMIKPGISEREVAAALEYRMRQNGADGISFDTIVVSGVNSSKPHGVPGAKCIEAGDFVTIDFGAVKDGYHSDTTRTFAVGYATDEMRAVYNAVLRAQIAACNAIRPGLSCKEYDGVARSLLAEAGYGQYFTHSLGHGVGVEIHEQPFCGPASPGILQAGNVISAEPGIYMEGKFGVRIEDMLMVTENGARNFCTLDKNLMVL